MSKQSIIAITICLVICGAFSQNKTNGSNSTKLQVPSAATLTAKAQQDAADAAVEKAAANVKLTTKWVAENQTLVGTKLKAMATASSTMSNLLQTSWTADVALQVGKAQAVAAAAAKAAAGVALTRATADNTCASGLATWAGDVGKQVGKTAAGATIDLVPPADGNVDAMPYLKARKAMVIPTAFTGLLNDMNTAVNAFKARVTLQKSVWAGALKTGVTGDSWNTFATGGYANIDTPVVSVAAGNGYKDMEACNTGQTQAGSATVCLKAAFGTWYTLMGKLLTTSGPGYFKAVGMYKGYDALQTWMGTNAKMLDAYNTATAAASTSPLNTQITAVKTLMDEYKAQADTLKAALTAAAGPAATAVANDVKTLADGGLTAVAAKAVETTAQAVVDKTKLVTDSVAAGGDWGKALAAVTSAAEAVMSGRTSLTTLVNAQLTAQVALRLAQCDVNCKTQMKTDTAALSSNLQKVLSGWQTNDGNVNKVLTAAQGALKKQVNATTTLLKKK